MISKTKFSLIAIVALVTTDSARTMERHVPMVTTDSARTSERHVPTTSKDGTMLQQISNEHGDYTRLLDMIVY